MTSIRPFRMEDLFELNTVNLDPLTENFNLLFYYQYLTQWPDLFFKAVENSKNAAFGHNYQISGYMMGKTEGQLARKEWHTHITAVTIDEQYRRIGLASDLCINLENTTAVKPHETLFVDLFVMVKNTVARTLYEKLGYSVYRRVVGYYGSEAPTDRTKLSDQIDAFDMRKALPCDKHRETVRDDGERHYVLPQEVVF